MDMLPTLQFKEGIYKNFVRVRHHPNLIILVQWFLETFGEAIVTSAKRDRKIYPGDSGIHMVKPLRAIDIRSKIYASPEGMKKYINSVWEYDPKRPQMNVCVYHNTGRGLHFHLQVHDRTRLRP